MYKSLGSASGQKTANGYAAHRLLLRFHFAEESSRVGRSCLALDNRVNRARISLMPMLAVVMKMAKQSEAVKRLLTGAWLVAGALALGAPATSSAINAVAPSAGAIQQDAPAAPNCWAARYSAGVADIVKMVDAKVDPQIVKAYIQNSPTAYNPSATEIIALKDRGVGPDILTAMLQHGAEVRTQAMRAAPGAANPPLPQAPSGVANPYAPGYDNSVQAAYPAYPYTYADTSYAYAYPSYCYGGYNYGSCWPWYWPSFSFGCYPYGGYCGYPSLLVWIRLSLLLRPWRLGQLLWRSRLLRRAWLLWRRLLRRAWILRRRLPRRAWLLRQRLCGRPRLRRVQRAVRFLWWSQCGLPLCRRVRGFRRVRALLGRLWNGPWLRRPRGFLLGPRGRDGGAFHGQIALIGGHSGYIGVAKRGGAATLAGTVCIWAHPVWCAFFESATDEEFAWAGLIGLSVPSAVTGPKSSGRADRGLSFFVQTILCRDCRELYDAVTRLRVAG